MADDRQVPRDENGDGSGPRAPDPDPRPQPGAGPDATAVGGTIPDPTLVGGASPDPTVADDRTVAVPPPVSPAQTRAPAWAGRAGVPPPRPGTPAGAADWVEEYDPGRRWWMPILVGLVALLLVGALIFGVWLILQSGEDEPGPVLPSPSPSVTSARPTSVAPTTTRPAPSATTEATVSMPALVGLPRGAATELLDRLDLSYRIEFRSAQEPTGTVIETDPLAGAEVGPDDEVTLVISRRSSPDPATTGPTATAEAGPNG